MVQDHTQGASTLSQLGEEQNSGAARGEETPKSRTDSTAPNGLPSALKDDHSGTRGGSNTAGPPMKPAPSPIRSHTPSPEQQEKPTPQATTLQLRSTLSLLVFATIWGVLARLGLLWVGGFAEGEVFSLIWAQVVGCMVMGLVTDRKTSLETLYAPLFVACGTGLCGSLTTFSSWMHDVFIGFANVDEPTMGRFNGFMSGLAITIVTLGLSIASLSFGSHLSSFLPHLPARRSSTPRHLLPILLGPMFWLGAILLLAFGPHSWRHRATFAIVLGPPGTLLRYFFSRRLNPINSSLPLGTLAANTLAVLIFAIVAILQRRPNVSNTGCAALQGVLDGFCGSLSTVSTLVVELKTLGRRDSYRYFGLSWMLGQALMVVILGSWLWSGDRGGVCSA